MKTIFVSIVLSLGLASVAGAAPPSEKSAVTENKLNLPLDDDGAAHIVKTPSGNDMGRMYPPFALQLNIPGRAVMTCEAEVDGRLDDCSVTEEAPSGLGFGAAAIRLASEFTIKPAMASGGPVKSQMAVPIKFQLGDAPEPPSPEDIPPPTSSEALDLSRQIQAEDDEKFRLRTQAAAVLKTLNAAVVAGGDAAGGEPIADAYRQATEDVIEDELDRRARFMAAAMTADQLRVVLAYAKTPAGKAYGRAWAKIDNPERPNLWRRVSWAARQRICGTTTCPAALSNPTP